MVVKHLYPSGKFTELVMSLYTTMFGVWIFISIKQGFEALNWTNMSPFSQMNLGYLFLAMGVLHALGVYINGRWWASPIIRGVAMFSSSIAIAYISTLPENPMSSARFTYSFIFFWYLIASINALRDVSYSIALKGLKNARHP